MYTSAAGVFQPEARKRLYKRPVGLENVLVEKPLRLHPFETLPVEATRLTGKALDNPHGEFHVSIVVGMGEAHKWVTRRDLYTKLLPKLASEGVRFGLPHVHFATRKFPPAGHVLAGRSLGDQYASVAVVESRRDDKEGRLHSPARAFYSTLVSVPWQCLNFLPDPQGHSSLRPTLRSPRTNVPCASGMG